MLFPVNLILFCLTHAMNVSVRSTQFDTASLVLFPACFDLMLLFTMSILSAVRLFLFLDDLLFKLRFSVIFGDKCL